MYELQFCKLDTPYVTDGSSYDRQTDRQTPTEAERHCLSKINSAAYRVGQKKTQLNLLIS